MELIGRGYPHAHCEATRRAAGKPKGAECGRRAEYRHDGVDLCLQHARVAAMIHMAGFTVNLAADMTPGLPT